MLLRWTAFLSLFSRRRNWTRERARGLATVYGIVRQHGGFLHVYSEVGIGMTFRIYLPATPGTEKAVAIVEESRAVRGGSETILIAEDHEGLRELARETLANLGYEILIACHGEEAVRLFQANRDRVDLLLLDVVMPKVNGPEAYARISAEKAGVALVFATRDTVPKWHCCRTRRSAA
jgi:Response regulator receiver domain